MSRAQWRGCAGEEDDEVEGVVLRTPRGSTTGEEPQIAAVHQRLGVFH